MRHSIRNKEDRRRQVSEARRHLEKGVGLLNASLVDTDAHLYMDFDALLERLREVSIRVTEDFDNYLGGAL